MATTNHQETYYVVVNGQPATGALPLAEAQAQAAQIKARLTEEARPANETAKPPLVEVKQYLCG